MSPNVKSGKPCRWWNNDLLVACKSRIPAILAFVLVALASIAGIEAVLSKDDEPNLGLFGKKVEFLRETHDQYNVLFIGTSSIYRMIDPVVLGEVTAKSGCDVRAYNLGTSKLRLTELRHIRDHLIGDYDLIVLSPMAASGIRFANWPSSRVQHFSDWEGYTASLIDLWDYPMTKRTPKLAYYSALLSGAFLYRQLGIGRLTGGLDGWPRHGADNATGDVFDGAAILDFSRHGFVALDDEPHDQFKRRRHGILNNPGYFENLKITNPDRAQFEGAAAERAWRRYQRAMAYFAEFDIPILMFLPPMVARRTQNEALADYASAAGMPILNYNRLDQYPQFFDRAKWFDFYHTNKSGAVAVSEMLGRDLCSFLNVNRS